jgi:hypothetical protein
MASCVIRTIVINFSLKGLMHFRPHSRYEQPVICNDVDDGNRRIEIATVL